jgi:predicted MFS family arabinose efflux permease
VLRKRERLSYIQRDLPLFFRELPTRISVSGDALVSAVAQSDSAPVPRSTVIAVLAATTIAQIASVMGIAVFPVIAPRLAPEMGVAPATIGYQISLIYGAATFGSPLMSFAVGRWGACRASQVGLCCCVMAMLLALTASLAALAATSILLGLAMTLMTPASAHLLYRFSPARNRNFIFSVKQTGVPLAWVIMALIAPGITLAFGWRWAVATVLIVTLVLVVLLQGVRQRWDDDRNPRATLATNPISGLVAVWRRPVLRWLAISSLALSFVQLCLGTFVITMLVEEGGYSLVTAGVMLSLVQGAGVAGRIVWGYIADKTRNSLGLLQKLAVTATLCCIVIAFLTPQWPAAVVGLVLLVFGAAAVGWNGLFLAEVARCSPRGMVSVATSAAMTWNFAGILVGPALFAATYNLTGRYTSTYALLSLIGIAAVIALGLCRRAGRQERTGV